MVWVIVGAAVVLALLVTIYFTSGWIALLVALGVTAVAVAVLLRYTYVHLNEMEVGVIFWRDGNFSRFLQPGFHMINPFLEYQESVITKAPQTASGTDKLFRSKEGIPVTVTWSTSFFIDVTKIKPGLENRLARALPKNAVNMVAGRTKHVLRHIIETKGIEELHGPGTIQSMEQEVRLMISQRMSHLGILEISAPDMKLGPIEMPSHVEAALEAAYERKLTVDALDRLQAVIRGFTEDDMQKLGELERLRIINNADVEVYMMDGGAGGGRSGGRNGRPPLPGMM